MVGVGERSRLTVNRATARPSARSTMSRRRRLRPINVSSGGCIRLSGGVRPTIQVGRPFQRFAPLDPHEAHGNVASKLRVAGSPAQEKYSQWLTLTGSLARHATRT